MSKNLKNAVLGILVFLIICFAFLFQKPMLTTGEATNYAVGCLNNPPKELGIKTLKINFDDITSAKLSIDKKSGLFNELTNQLVLGVTMKTKFGDEPTVRINAYNGKCIKVTGPLN